MDTQNEELPEDKQQAEEKPKAKNPSISPSAGTKDTALVEWFVGAGAAIFFLVLIFWTASLTIGIMDIVMPHNKTVKYFALALFDGGALVWLGMYVYKAKGVPQRGVTLLMFVIDLLGVILMTAGGVYMGGQALADVPAWMGKGLVNGVIFATLTNVVGAYYFKLNDPDTREAAQAQALEDTINEEAMRQARAAVQREARQLGGIMARRATARIKYRLALPMSTNELAEWEGETVEGEEVQPAQIAAPVPDTLGVIVGNWLKHFFTQGLQPKSPQSESIPTTPNTDSNSNDDHQPG